MDRRVVALSTIVLFELEYGVERSENAAANRDRLQTFLSRNFAVLPLAHIDVAAAARIRVQLERQKQPIGPFDTLIAGQALARNLTLVTANTREFSRIPGLRWQDWADPAR